MIQLNTPDERPGPPEGALVLVRLLRGEPAEPLQEEINRLPQPWREITSLACCYPPEERKAKVADIISHREDAQSLLDAINLAQMITRPRTEGDLVPSPLPDGALLDAPAGTAAGELLDCYIEYSRAVSPMTPFSFHVSAALWLVSTAIARRLVLQMPFGPIYPNLFVAWVAPTTMFHKTTALQLAAKIAREVFPHLLAPHDSTPESLLADMAGEEVSNLDRMPAGAKDRWEAGRRFAGQRGWILDEMSGLLVRANRDYNGGLLETLMGCYDCQDDYVRSTRGQGWVMVKNAYLSLLGASTPDALAPFLAADRYWTGGWWPRFALLAPDVEKPAYETANGSEAPGQFVDGLNYLHAQLPAGSWPEPPAAIPVVLGDGVADAHERYTRAATYEMVLRSDLDHRLHGVYGRLPVQVLKVAINLAALDWKSDSPIIQLRHLARAQHIVETWRASAHRVLARAGASEYDRMRGRVRRFLSSVAPQSATHREICRALNGVKPDVIFDTLRQMVAAGEVEGSESRPGPRGGRPTDRYHLAR